MVLRWLSGCCVRSLSSYITHETSTHSPVPASAPRAPPPRRITQAQSIEFLSSFLAFASSLHWCMGARTHEWMLARNHEASISPGNHEASFAHACLQATTHTLHACLQATTHTHPCRHTQTCMHIQASLPNSCTCACTCVRMRLCESEAEREAVPVPVPQLAPVPPPLPLSLSLL
jgi:hypothetical protein